MKTNFNVGIDLSKDWFDYALLNSRGEFLLAARHKNTASGMRKMMREIRKVAGKDLSQVLFCCESTGIYGNILEQFAATLPLMQLWVAHAADIKKCMGVVRGKSDSVDAARIAQYAARYSDKARLWKPQSTELVQLRALTALRQRLQRAYNQLLVPINELKKFDKPSAALVEKSCAQSIRTLKKEIKKVDVKIQEIIGESKEIMKNFSLIKTIPGVGSQTAIALLIATRNFTQMNDARKLACYAGVAPFEYQSGKSIRGRKRVSKFANKALKTVLHLAAMAATRSDAEIKQYFHRKAEEGKNKMAVINAVRFKILTRVISVVKRGTPFIPKENFEPRICK